MDVSRRILPLCLGLLGRTQAFTNLCSEVPGVRAKVIDIYGPQNLLKMLNSAIYSPRRLV